MKRGEFLKRCVVGAIAVQTVDLESFKAAFTETYLPTTSTTIAPLSMNTMDQILTEYYLPVVKEALNRPSVLLNAKVVYAS